MQLTISRYQQLTERENRWGKLQAITSETASAMMPGFQYPSFESAAAPCLIGGFSDILDTLNRKHEGGARFV